MSRGRPSDGPNSGLVPDRDTNDPENGTVPKLAPFGTRGNAGQRDATRMLKGVLGASDKDASGMS